MYTRDTRREHTNRFRLERFLALCGPSAPPESFNGDDFVMK